MTVGDTESTAQPTPEQRAEGGPAGSGPEAANAAGAAHTQEAHDTADERRRADVLRALLWTFVVLTAAIAVIGLVAGSPREAAISGGGSAGYALLLAAHRRLGTNAVSYLTTLLYFALATGAMASGRGIHDVTMVLFPAGMLMGAMLLRRRHLVPLVVLTVATVAAVGVWRALDPDPRWPRSESPLAEVAVVSLLLVVAGVLTRLVIRGLQAMVAERRRAEEALLLSKRELEARNRALEVVSGLASRLQRTMEVEAIAGESVDALVQLSQPPAVAFYLLTGDGADLRLVAAHGFTDDERRRGATLPLEGSLSGVAIGEQRLVTSDDFGNDSRVFERVRSALAARGFNAAVCVPLVFGGEALGTVNLLYRERRPFAQGELDDWPGGGAGAHQRPSGPRARAPGVPRRPHRSAEPHLPPQAVRRARRRRARRRRPRRHGRARPHLLSRGQRGGGPPRRRHAADAHRRAAGGDADGEAVRGVPPGR